MSDTAETITIKLGEIGEHLITHEQGVHVRDLVLAGFRAGKRVVLDFEGAHITPSDFLCAAIGQLYGEYPREFIRENLSIENAGVFKLSTIKAVVESSVEYYAKKAKESKASDFAALAAAATPGKWSVEWMDGVGGIGIAAPEAYIAFRIEIENQKNADFIAWCANNRAWLQEAARLKEAVENPSDDLFLRIAESVVEQRISGVLSGQKAVKITPSVQTLNEVRFALAALADAVK